MKTRKNVLFALSLLCVTLVTFSACNDPKQPEEKKFEFDDNSYLYLNVQKDNTMKAEAETPIPKDQNLTPQQIMKVATAIEALLKEVDRRGATGVSEEMKDYENCRFVMAPWMVIKKLPEKLLPDGTYTYKYELNETWITNRDVTLLAVANPELGIGPSELIGYIPNKQMEEAEKAIREAFAQKDSEKVFKLFNEAYTFIPIRQAEYDKLKANGEL